ncbi:MAG: hypothetical protein CO150_07400 [Nitrospirae bacterium CG_4_9_14_3_um_filter_53_35]|nr:MAG: hypothetical protein AUK29_00070 [Nitrospirae bacterium CG2_30_53_67]PIS37487.1 MAG: hypothetical protein COT35_05850 [Nitrospirae bacterium CG08_land_8_20_14_0_20_52_24]PIV82927.1 MAG: hypothetical protein COW52_10790 [Nitrospirae bacterium CG17_big_fil_post_rev_8_21_14_2_50_50_9]PIW85119.1 MAG: hypothetical protein COZ95_06335 [Nitrospirae bacterium CG_4_8_14_3_um_filter_50_41]PIX86779.1 MAG: hypothetical protein COZ32_01500 [Nitrospirae bacterium CG_4_10_14_3_um_filter_53_41]PJA7385
MNNRLLREQVAQLDQHAPLGLIGTAINALILVWILRNQAPQTHLMAWLAAVLLVTLLRLPLLYRKIPLFSGPDSTRRLAVFLISGAGLSGAAWGSASLIIFPTDSIVHQTFMAFVVGGMVAGAAGLYSVMMTAFLAFSLPVLIPLIFRFLAAGDEIHVAMGGMTFLFAVLMTFTAKRIHATTINNISLQFEKGDLIVHLTEAKEETEIINRELASEILERKRVEENLKRHKEQLEEKVAERTRELSFTNQRLQQEIDERTRLENELLQAEKLKSLGLLAGGIAHDFNNLLTGILGNISLAKMETPAGERLHDTLTESEKAAVRAKALTQQLLTFSTGGAPVKKRMFPADLIRDTATFALSGSNVRCRFDLASDLWPLDADEGQISQVINNLVINAHQAMPNGGTIRISAENLQDGADKPVTLEQGNYIRITVQDQGCGIPEEHLSRIFDPYFTTKQTGSGLGLATCYSIIRKHGGCITAESKLRAGATFRIYLPASSAPVAKAREPEHVLPAAGGRILVMDDEEMIRKTICAMLIRLGFSVESVHDGAEAIAVYQAAREAGSPFQAAIMDLTVPGGMGGKEAASLLLQMDPEARIIISSGYSNDPVMADYRDHGISGVMMKPYTTQELGAILNNILGERGKH